jgi:hypothetical protein
MRRAGLIASLALSGAMLLASIPAPAAMGAGTHHTYAVFLTIYVDRAEHKVKGTITSPDAPSEFCDQGTVRLMQVMPGKDKKLNFVKPGAGNWGFRIPAKLHGNRVYAEVLGYDIPGRPVTCLPAKSRIVTAP